MSVEAPPEKYVVVRLSDTVRLGLPQLVVREALDMTGVVVSPMPGAPPVFRGVTNLRGSFLWVLDTAAWLRQLEPALPLPQTPGREGLVVTVGQRTLVMTIQGRDGFLPVTPAQIQPLPRLRHKHLFPGMTRWEGHPVALVDPTAWFQMLHQFAAR
ncbi:MAG: chemotaxis protein CheW [Gloeomargarita sp. SKYBB_i_bin120]|nr:chemotaxis protein CheW [Gloeomargarita sp. SKYG98]MCS7292808.1 chemotaxis protein CheW [Gloeomargarita sp. SKYB120]MDW8178371.1 chemotaxis protein CheW [Gloeomargarita sp. SKYBB_i_bin120]